MERRLAAILAADVVGYSGLMEFDEAGTLARLKGHRQELIDPKVSQYGGRVVKLMGDGMLAEFPSVVDAVQCAIDVQRGMADRNSGAPLGQRIEFRVGVNLGDVIIEGEDIYGEGVNVAARLEALAVPGGICVSDVVHQSLGAKLDLGFEDLGQQRVKNIEKAIRVYRVLLEPDAADRVIGEKRLRPRRWQLGVVAAGGLALAIAVTAAALWQRWAPDVEPASVARMAFPLPDKPSIAVLPFDNLSGDPTQEHLSDGLSEDIIAALSRLPDLFVIARNSSFTYKGKPVKVQRVAEELGVRYVLEGSLQRSGDKLRVNAQLVDALSGHHLWSQTYDRMMTELFALKDDITLHIVSGLQVQLVEGQMVALKRHETNNLQAWLLFKEGQGHALRFTKEDNAIAREMYERALTLDPEFVSVYVGLGFRHLQDARFRWSQTPEKSFEKAVELAQKARGLNPSHSGVYVLLNGIHLFAREYEEAISVGRKALALDPNNYDAAAMLAFAHQKALQAKESIRLFKIAMRLSPYSPDWVLEGLGESYVIAGQYEEAIAAYRKLLARDPGASLAADAHVGLALSYNALGREKEARDEITKATEIYPRYTVSYLREWQLYKDPAYIERYLATLRRLGLPEE